MSESNNQSTGKSWFFLGDYQPTVPPNSSAEVNLQTLMDCLTLQQKELCKLYKRVEDLDYKLEKLIESNKSLIAYFSAMNDRDARDLNYRIRGFSSKNHLPPSKFVPDRRNKLI